MNELRVDLSPGHQAVLPAPARAAVPGPAASEGLAGVANGPQPGRTEAATRQAPVWVSAAARRQALRQHRRTMRRRALIVMAVLLAAGVLGQVRGWLQAPASEPARTHAASGALAPDAN